MEHEAATAVASSPLGVAMPQVLEFSCPEQAYVSYSRGRPKINVARVGKSGKRRCCHAEVRCAYPLAFAPRLGCQRNMLHHPIKAEPAC